MPLGDEVAVPLFTRATPTLVALNPVARFSADGPRPFGPYTLKSAARQGYVAVPQTLATLAEGQHQTLNPELEGGGDASFDPGAAVFGLWVRAGKRTIYRRIVATAAPTSTQHGSSRCARAAVRRRRTRIWWRFAMRPTTRFRTTCSCSGTSSR